MNKYSRIKKGQRNPLWDGEQQGLTNKLLVAVCASCGGDINFTFIDSEKLKYSQVHKAIIPSLLAEKIITERGNGEFKDFVLKKEYPAYVLDAVCPNCGAKNSIILGMKEIQPQRYVVYLGGMVVTS